MSTRAQHTPGPWQQGYNDGSGPEYITHSGAQPTIAALQWGCSCCKPDRPLTPEQQANADLIAAAPDLLAELRRLLQSFDDRRPIDFGPTRHLIAKARGEL